MAPKRIFSCQIYPIWNEDRMHEVYSQLYLCEKAYLFIIPEEIKNRPSIMVHGRQKAFLENQETD